MWAIALLWLMLPATMATPLSREDSRPERPLFGAQPLKRLVDVSAFDIDHLPNLPAGSGWFTAALMAMAAATKYLPVFTQSGASVVGDNLTATFTLYDPLNTGAEPNNETVKVTDVIGGTDTVEVPWWAAGYYQAMKQSGPFTSQGNGLKFQLGVDKTGEWLTPTSRLDAGMTYTPPAIYGLQILMGKKPHTYVTKDKGKIKSIAELVKSEYIPVIVQTNKGLVTDSAGFKGDTSDGLHEYGILGFKRDGGVMIKGEANLLSPNAVVDLDDLVNHLVMFISTVDLKAKLEG